MKKAEILSFKMVFSSLLMTFVLYGSPSQGQEMFPEFNHPAQAPSKQDIDSYIRHHVRFQRAERDDSLLFAEPERRRDQSQDKPEQKEPSDPSAKIKSKEKDKEKDSPPPANQ